MHQLLDPLRPPLLPLLQPLLRLLLLDRGLHQSLPLPSPRAPLRALYDDRLREPLFAPRELLGALLLALFVALAERGHGGFEEGAVGSVEAIELAGFDLGVAGEWGRGIRVGI